MKKINAQSLINEATHELEKIAPRNSEIEIDILEDSKGHYSTHIKLMSKYKIYFAKKDDDLLYKSFNKAIKAIKAQLAKKRIDHIHTHQSLKYHF